MEPQILFENRDLVVLNKPAGLLVHDDRGKEESLVDWLLSNLPEVSGVGDDLAKRPGIVHRLDKDTSGVLLVPRTQAYFVYLKELFLNKKVKKTYWAIIIGHPKNKEGIINMPISLKSGTIKRTVHGGKMTKEAVTRYRVLKELKDSSLVEISPETGRTHQIRVHMASIGHPVLGDTLYGSVGKKSDIPRQMLHAFSLEFELEPGRAIKLTADPPADFEDTLKKLEK